SPAASSPAASSPAASSGSHWCDGDCQPVLREALVDAMRELAARYGDDPATWRWGEVHQAIFAHPILRNVPLLGSLSTISVPSPGDDDTIDRGGTDRAFRSVHGAAYRGVYDLADLDRSLFMIAPGQSGNLFDVHARDFIHRWRDGATITLGPTAATVIGTVRLVP
ncbi:MAG TPA: penicillin acylase family protein, partial [Rhodopila sp.]